MDDTKRLIEEIKKQLSEMSVDERKEIEKPKVEDSIALVRELINYDKLLVSEKCKSTLNEFETYRYRSAGENGYNSEDADTPLKVNDDCMDALRYALFKHLTTFRRM